MSNRDRVLDALRSSIQPLDDDQIAARAGLVQRQTANVICRQLAAEGLIIREPGPSGKIVNRLTARSSTAAEDVPVGVPIDAEPAGSSRVQRDAERHMLRELSVELGVHLAPRSLRHPSGPRVELDGAAPDLSVLVECWAHQGSAKVAQKYKLMNDAAKLHWIAGSLHPAPERLIICVSDVTAIRHLAGSSWQAAAIRDLGVEFVVVNLAPDIIAEIRSAQVRQFR